MRRSEFVHLSTTERLFGFLGEAFILLAIGTLTFALAGVCVKISRWAWGF